MNIFTKKIGLITALTAPLMTSNITQAEQPLGIWDIGARLNTEGIQGEVGYIFNRTFAMRLQAGGLDHYKTDVKFQNEKYDNVRYRPIVTTLYADWYFWTTWWRVSAGVSYNHTKIEIHQDFTEHDLQHYRLMEKFKATYRYKQKISPYLGTGVEFRNLFGSNFIFTADAGINFFGEVKVKASGSGPAGQMRFAMAIARKKARKLLNEQWWIKTFPAVSIGIKYEFS